MSLINWSGIHLREADVAAPMQKEWPEKDSEKFWTMKELGENVKETMMMMMVVVGLRGEFILKQNIKRGLPN